MAVSNSSLLLQCLSRPGPSRLASRLHPCASCVRRASTTSARSESQASHSPAPRGRQRSSSSSSSASDEGPKVELERHEGFKTWFATIAQKYRYPPDNGPNWLGGDVPYASNPSFKPPPPLSDTLKEIIYQEHFYPPPGAQQGLTVPEISAKHGVSKARVTAVLKLKAMEKGWEKDGKALQTPFQEAMERYLAVQNPRPSWRKTGGPSAGSIPTIPSGSDFNASKLELEIRTSHPASKTEAAEEAAHDSFLAGQAAASADRVQLDDSAFTARDTVVDLSGQERTVFEFRDESLDKGATTPGGSAALDVPFNRVFTPEQLAKLEKYSKLAADKKVATKGARDSWKPEDGKAKYAYRFLDAGAGAGAELSGVGMGKRQSREADTQSHRKAMKRERKKRAIERAASSA